MGWLPKSEMFSIRSRPRDPRAEQQETFAGLACRAAVGVESTQAVCSLFCAYVKRVRLTEPGMQGTREKHDGGWSAVCIVLRSFVCVCVCVRLCVCVCACVWDKDTLHRLHRSFALFFRGYLRNSLAPYEILPEHCHCGTHSSNGNDTRNNNNVVTLRVLTIRFGS